MATLEPTLEINNATDDDGDTLTYLFETDQVNTFDSPARQKASEIAEGSDGTTSWTPAELDDNTLYYWRVRAFDGAVYGDWATGTFLANVDNEPPDIPTIQNPDEGCLLTMSLPTLSVYPATDPDQDEITYDYEVYFDANLQDLVTSTENEGTSWKVDVGLEDQALYYWRTRAFDGVDYSDWCPLVSFSLNTGNAQPGAPTHNNPFNGGIVTTLTPTLSVNNAEDPDNPILTYEFELYSDVSLTEPVTSALVSQGILITSWTVDTALTDNMTYYWQARALDDKLAGSWMNTAFFVVDTGAAKMDVTPACAKEAFASAESAQTAEVKKRWSPLKGVSVEIPAGALQEDCTVTIGLVENPPALPNNTKAISKVIDFGPDGTIFNSPVTVRIPYTLEDLFSAGVSDPALLQIWTYNTMTQTWEEIPVDHVDTVNMFLVYMVDHFSLFTTAKSVPAASSGETGGGAGGVGGGGCFIATAAYGSYMEPSVMTLRQFRDIYLAPTALGKHLLNFYYQYSPPLAELIAENDTLRSLVRFGLAPVVCFSWVAIYFGPLSALFILFIVFAGVFALTALLFRHKTQNIPKPWNE